MNGQIRLAGGADAADAGAFLARVTRLDAGALIRIRSAEPGLLTLWARSPLDVLVTRSVTGSGPDDLTVGAADLLAALAGAIDDGGTTPELVLPPRRDAEWRGSLPPAGPWRSLDVIPATVVRDLIAAGERAFGAVTASGAGQSIAGVRAAGESLLDHPTLRVSAGPPVDPALVAAGSPATGPPAAGSAPGTAVVEVTVPFRMLMAIRRMGFLGPGPGGPAEHMEVAILGPWLRVTAPFGAVYRRRDTMLLKF